MPTKTAPDLYYRVHCQKRVNADDGYGNTQAGWQTEFTVAASFKNLRGGEGVIAARLENRHPMVVTVRRSSQTEQIAADWRLVDARETTVFAVRDVTHEAGRHWISLLCERGVAA